MSSSVVDTTTGRVALSRRQLSAVCAQARAGASRPSNDDDEAAGRASELEEIGAIADGQVVPLLRPVIGVVTAVRARGVLRRWFGRTLPVVELFVGAGGVVVLPDGVEPDVPQQIRWHPRGAAVPRLLAELLDLPTGDALPVFGDDPPRAWRELVELATRPDTGIGLADLRWAGSARRQPETVMVLAWHGDGGIVEVTSGGPGTLAYQPRHPLEVWTGLTKLAAKAQGAG